MKKLFLVLISLLLICPNLVLASGFSKPAGAGSGDMDKATYDSNDNGVVDTTTALAANGANCSAGSYALGVDASGAAESCTDATTEITSVADAKVDDTAYNATTWNGVTTIAPSKNAVRDKLESFTVSETDPVIQAIYDAQTILRATSDNTPTALTIGEQTVAGRATGANIAALAIDSDLTTVSASDDTLPSAKAAKQYVDDSIVGAGAGDVTSVGDCASGACYDGTSDGGTYAKVYDGDSNYGEFLTSNLTGNRLYTFGNLALTFDQSVASGASPTFTGTNITAAATATALVSNGANCSSGNSPLGVDASGASESCFDVATQTELDGQKDVSETLTNKTLAAASNVIHADDAVNVIDADYGDIVVSSGVWAVDSNAVALGADTTNNYVATIADSGATEVTVANSGTESAAVTLAIASSITRDTEWDTIGEINTAVSKTIQTQDIDYQLPENKSILLDAALSADGKWSGISEAGTLGDTIAFGDIVYLKAADSQWYLTDADADSTAGAVKIGVCVVAGNDNDPTTILLFGKINAASNFPALTVGAPVYLSTDPGNVQTGQPNGTDDVIRIVGYGNTGDELYVNPSNDYVTHT